MTTLKRPVGWALLLLLIFIGPVRAPAQSQATAVPGELIVGLKSSAATSSVQAVGASAQAFGGRIVDEIPELGLVLVRVPEASAQSVASAVQSLPNVAYTEANIIYEMTDSPNDPQWGQQWGPLKIQAPQAWELERGSRSILVAVVDSGVDYNHPDIRDNYVAKGHDFVEDDDDPFPSGHGRGISHGTHVAGIIGAAINNGTGIAGLAQVSLMAVRVLNEEGQGDTMTVAHGIVFAAKAKANIINLSLGAPKAQRAIEEAVNFAVEAGSLVVAAAGNTKKEENVYPAAYPGALAVSATDRQDRLAEFSTYGRQVELAAPGEGILSTVPGGKLKTMSGTSMAAPHVAGVAALAWSHNPSLTNEQVRRLLCNTADDLGPRGRDVRFGCGRVNALQAVRAARGVGEEPPSSAPVFLEVDAGCGGGYRVGEEVTVSFGVDQPATVTLYRLGHEPGLELLAIRPLGAHDRQSLPPFRVERAGVETVVLQAKTQAGQVLTRACTFAVGDARLDQAQLKVEEKGCGADYDIGEPITLSLFSDRAGGVSVVDFSTDGSVSDILQLSFQAGETQTVSAQVVGPPGIDTLVMVVETDAGTALTAACSLVIR